MARRRAAAAGGVLQPGDAAALEARRPRARRRGRRLLAARRRGAGAAHGARRQPRRGRRRAGALSAAVPPGLGCHVLGSLRRHCVVSGTLASKSSVGVLTPCCQRGVREAGGRGPGGHRPRVCGLLLVARARRHAHRRAPAA